VDLTTIIGVVGIIVAIVIGAWQIYLSRRQLPPSPPVPPVDSEVRSEDLRQQTSDFPVKDIVLSPYFRAIWPSLSSHLKEDLAKSIASANVARLEAKSTSRPTSFMAYNPATTATLTPMHWETLSAQAPSLSDAITRYIAGSDQLQSRVHAYNQFSYPGIHSEGDLQTARQRMLAASLELESAHESLRSLLPFYDEVVENSPGSTAGA
jgi:hypothetical protein